MRRSRPLAAARRSRGRPLARRGRDRPLARRGRDRPLARHSRGRPLARHSRGRPLARVLPRRRLAVALLLGVAWMLWGGGDSVHAAGWRAPVDGAVIAPFDFDPARPYAAGRRRGLELAARRGEPVRSACGGEVTFAGRLPDGGTGVTVRCGSLAATHLRLASASVRRGAHVPRGASLGTAAGGSVRLGARRIGERHGYVDPATLVAGGPSVAPPAAPVAPPPPPSQKPPRPLQKPLPPAPHPLPAVQARRVAAVRQRRHRPERRRPGPPVAHAPPVAQAPRGGETPLSAWAGLALLAVGVPAGGVLRARRRTVGGAPLGRRAPERAG
jgi:hypothetical protein